MTVGVIAAKASRLLPPAGAVALDASDLARAALGCGSHGRLSVITNGLATFNRLLEGGSCLQPVLTGGTYDPLTDQLLGPIALQAARRMATIRFFMSAEAVDPGLGALEGSLDSADIKLAMSGLARETVLLARSSQLGRRGRAPSIPWPRIGVLVTELDPAHPLLEEYRCQVEVL